MKAILKSIRPQHTCNILNGLKIIEIDKSAPKEWKDYLSGKTKEKPKPREVLIYCTKGNKDTCLEYADNPDKTKEGKWVITSGYPYGNQKVLAKFTLNKVEEIFFYDNEQVLETSTNTLKEEALLKKCCLSFDDLYEYSNGTSKTIYAWHIDNLVIFDKQKELSEFKRPEWEKCGVKDKNGLYQCHKCPYAIHYGHGFGDCGYDKPLKSPQSWCYVEEQL